MKRFDRVFTLAGIFPVSGWLAVAQAHWPARSGVFCAPPVIMGGDTFIEVIGDAGIQAAITAFDNVNMPSHENSRLRCAIGLA